MTLCLWWSWLLLVIAEVFWAMMDVVVIEVPMVVITSGGGGCNGDGMDGVVVVAGAWLPTTSCVDE